MTESHPPAALKRAAFERAHGCCEYCLRLITLLILSPSNILRRALAAGMTNSKILLYRAWSATFKNTPVLKQLTRSQESGFHSTIRVATNGATILHGMKTSP